MQRMERRMMRLLIYHLTIKVIICGEAFVRDEYRTIPQKRLTDVIKTVKTSSAFHCTTWCSMTDGCLTVNVIGNHDITCELTTGLSNETEMQDDHSSELLVLDYNKCLEEPGFCFNGATYEPSWTSARCLCTDRSRGDRCDECTERFQGDECDQCVDRFQGDDCQDCSSRFQGDGGLECAENHYGDDCDVTFTTHTGTYCNANSLDVDDCGNAENVRRGVLEGTTAAE